MTAKTFKVQNSYIKLNLVVCAVALIDQFMDKTHHKAKNMFLTRVHVSVSFNRKVKYPGNFSFKVGR